MPGLATVCITAGNAKRIRTCVCSSFFFYFINSILCFVGAFTWKTKIKRSRLKWTSRSFLINSWQRVGCSTVSQLRSGCQEMYRRQLWKRQNHKPSHFLKMTKSETRHITTWTLWNGSTALNGLDSGSRCQCQCTLPLPDPPPSAPSHLLPPDADHHTIIATLEKRSAPSLFLDRRHAWKPCFVLLSGLNEDTLRGECAAIMLLDACLSWIMLSSPYSLLLWWHYRARVSGDVGRCVCAGHRPDSVTRYWRKSATL